MYKYRYGTAADISPKTYRYAEYVHKHDKHCDKYYRKLDSGYNNN